MAVSATELIEARETTARLLDGLGLDAYLFEVEPGENHWTVRVECAVDGGWETVSLPVDREVLSGGADDQRRQALLRQWRERLLACTPRRSR
jgi:hypothetical protein